MRILNVTQTYAPFFEFGGPPVKVGALARGLASRGHQVTVLTPDWGLQEKIQAAPKEISADLSPFGLRITSQNLQAIYLPTWFRYRSLTWNPALKRYLRVRLREFDVVHIFGLYDFLGPAVTRACRERKIPYVVEPIGMFLPIVRSIRLKRLYHSLWGKTLLRGAARIVATAEQEIEELASGGIPREKLVLRRNGIEPPATTPARGSFRSAYHIPEDSWFILFLGRLSAKKNPDLLLEAFASLPSTLAEKPLHLVFAGPDEAGMQARLVARASQLNLSSRVTFAGPVFDAVKWSAYLDADVFVLPSQNENFGNTAAEAAILGTPVILTDACGIAPLLANLSALVVPHSAESLARSLRTLLTDSSLRSRFSQNASVARARLGWDEPVAQMESLYTLLASPTLLDAKSTVRGR